MEPDPEKPSLLRDPSPHKVVSTEEFLVQLGPDGRVLEGESHRFLRPALFHPR